MKRVIHEIFTILIMGGVVQGVYLALLLNAKRVRRSRANLFLSLLLIMLSFSIAHILYAGSVFEHLSAEVYSLGDPTFLLIAPLLWLYVTELTGKRVVFSGRLMMHFVPFISMVICSLTFQSVRSDTFSHFLDSNHHLIHIIFWGVVVIQFSLYLSAVHKRLDHYQLLIQHEVSNPEGVNISWIRFFMLVFLLVNIFFLFSLFAVIHLEDRTWHTSTTALVFSFSVYALGFKGMLQKEVFYPLENTKEPLSTPSASYEPDQDLINEVVSYMKEKKPYLDSELTLSRLAGMLNMSRGQLSQLINSGIGENFYDFVNRFRVEEVKRLMRATDKSHFSLLGLALEAGFKSKSTFNLIFKRFTGLTPSEYRKNLSTQ